MQLAAKVCAKVLHILLCSIGPKPGCSGHLGVGLPDHGLGQNVVDDLVGDGLSGGHQLVELHAAIRTGHDFSAKEVTRGDVSEGKLHGDPLALGALARAGTTYKAKQPSIDLTANHLAPWEERYADLL